MITNEKLITFLWIASILMIAPTAFVFLNDLKKGKRFFVIIYLLLLSLLFALKEGAVFGLCTAIGLSATPIIAGLAKYLMCLFVRKSVERTHGPSGIKIKFDILECYRMIWN